MPKGDVRAYEWGSEIPTMYVLFDWGQEFHAYNEHPEDSGYEPSWCSKIPDWGSGVKCVACGVMPRSSDPDHRSTGLCRVCYVAACLDTLDGHLPGWRNLSYYIYAGRSNRRRSVFVPHKPAFFCAPYLHDAIIHVQKTIEFSPGPENSSRFIAKTDIMRYGRIWHIHPQGVIKLKFYLSDVSSVRASFITYYERLQKQLHGYR
ncbi:hypothetical protein DFS34DRAFT_594375 [Phlyctochytrium arcticum]|nr:hypothetical protein DFS34DRAFT_594375 [Phlyctochytrium arcticum]